MENQESQDNSFESMYNSGYYLAKYDPQTLKELLFEAEQNGTRGIEGLIWGMQEFENEMKKDTVKEFENIRKKGKDKDLDLEFEKW